MLTVIETDVFLRYAAKVWTEAERETFVDWIAEHPTEGDVIPGFAPLRKVRWGKAGKGKRGGVRVIYFVTLADGTVSLLIVYPKAKTENLSPAFMKELKKIMEE
jgi:mRNA-degrading endonuclease RelE of RelBE toxin-antitoxin system